MPKSEKQTRTTRTPASDSSRFNPVHPLLVPDDEGDLAEGETVLTFVAPPPDSDAPDSDD